MNPLALDIGGANIKAADGREFAASEAFPLWQRPEQLTDVLRTVIAGSPRPDHIVATMTGELADCFATKSDGVRFIIHALTTAADGRHTRIYQLDGKLVAPQVALQRPLLAAAANWHALARFAGRYAADGPALLVDIGSTTCDIIPLVDGKPAAAGTSDTERLLSGELVYTGIERSPVCAMVDALPWRGQQCPVAQELFATALDAYLIAGEIAELGDAQTADHRPATKAAARDRLARSICADRETFSMADAAAAGEAIIARQLELIAAAVRQVLGRLPGPPGTIVISGHGEFLARRVLHSLQLSAGLVSLNEQLGPTRSRCAPAHALAVLTREGNPQ